jgi:hypothetical protein
MEELKLERRQQDAMFIRETVGWPLWPFLPVKTLGDNRRIGFLFDGKEVQNRVFLMNLLSVKEYLDKGGKWEDIPSKQYDSLEALLDDGWVVD